MSERPTTYDVVICGGGLAGLTLARQLRQTLPRLSVAVIDRLTRPLPEAAFKVGESLVETGSHYMRETLRLGDYMRTAHLRKLGFRFFFSHPSGRLQDRPEYGLSEFPRIESYQIDRGILENDLRRFNAQDGVVLREGCTVQDIVLAGGGEDHEVVYASADGRAERVRTRWVVDAMGRRRYLQKRLNLTLAHGKKSSSAWFRLPGRIDVSDLVPDDVVAWHARVPGRNRYWSTTHLTGSGYWVWIIPLSSGNTSVGIVTRDELHPFAEFNTYPRALEWLQRHEPAFAAYLRGREPLDFRCMQEYSYASRQMFSPQRWACIGDASLFPDPFYGVANDLIGYGNTMLTDMIRLDQEGRLTPDVVKRYDRFVLSLNYWYTQNAQLGYPFMGNGVVMVAKVLWDTIVGWAMLAPQVFNRVFLDWELDDEYRRVSAGFFFLSRAVQQMFADWAAKSPGRASFEFVDFLKIPFVRSMQQRNLQARSDKRAIIENQILNVQGLEDLAQVLFLIAVEDVMPEHLDRFKPPVWLDAWEIGLDPAAWGDRLFQPQSAPRDLAPLRAEFRSLFRFSDRP